MATTLGKEYAERLMADARDGRFGRLPPGYEWRWCNACQSRTPQNYGLCMAHERPPTLEEIQGS